MLFLSPSHTIVAAEELTGIHNDFLAAVRCRGPIRASLILFAPYSAMPENLRMKKAVALLHPDITPRALLPFQEICPELCVCSDFASPEDTNATVIFGGDGTVHRYLPELNRRKVPVLVVPCGSGNDFARSVGIRNVQMALDAWEHFCRTGSNVLALDLGMIRCDGEEILFCCVACAGLDSHSNALANRMPAGMRGHGGYLVAALWCLVAGRAQKICVTSPQKQSTGAAWFVAVANASRYGGGLKIAPLANLKDGQLDVCRVAKMNKIKLLCALPLVFSGAHLRLREVEYFKTTAVRVESEPSLKIYADGEPAGRTPAEFSVLPEAIRVIVPVLP